MLVTIITTVFLAVLGLFTEVEYIQHAAGKEDKKERRKRVAIILLILMVMVLGIAKAVIDEQQKRAEDGEKRAEEKETRLVLQQLQKQNTLLLQALDSLGYARRSPTNEIVRKHRPLSVKSKFTVSGYVYDGEDLPLPNVLLNVSGLSNKITTDEAGMFEFAFAALPNDYNYSITYSKPGYQSQTYNYTEIPKTNIAVFLKPR